MLMLLGICGNRGCITRPLGQRTPPCLHAAMQEARSRAHTFVRRTQQMISLLNVLRHSRCS